MQAGSSRPAFFSGKGRPLTQGNRDPGVLLPSGCDDCQRKFLQNGQRMPNCACMKKSFSGLVFTATAVLFAGMLTAQAETLKINGATTPNLPVAEAAEILRAEKGMDIQVDTQGGSAGGISMLGDGLVQIGMTSKHVSDEDRAKYPKVNFKEIKMGSDAVALIVSRDVWENGVRAISKEEMQGIYEGRITNWKELGGKKSQRIAFFNKEPGRGTWENFANWAYGSAKKAPQASFPEVGGNEETRNKVASTRGALSQLSASWVDNEKIFALAIKGEDGKIIEPSNENVAKKIYPMCRDLSLLTNGEPTGLVKEFVDFMLGPRGQELVKKHGYLNLADLGEK